MNRDVLRAVRRKRRPRKKARCCPDETAKYRDAERDAARRIRNAKRNFEKILAKEKHGNSRPFFSYIKGKTKSKVTIGPLKDKQKNTVSGDEEMANVLNDYFARTRVTINYRKKSRWSVRHP